MENNNPKGSLFLIPTLLGATEPLEVLPLAVKMRVESLRHYIVENEKSARAFIKKVAPSVAQSSLVMVTLNKYTPVEEKLEYLNACLQGSHVGLMSEAGAPGIADPGAEIVAMAHKKGVKVVPLVGPSSILLAMMASGLNGQNFAFIGYLPADNHERRRSIKDLDQLIKRTQQSQIFIETPYRNAKLFGDLLQYAQRDLQLCIACNISTPGEFILTQSIEQWRTNKAPDLEKKPTIFILGA
jgi:16S rRNA (cytidine1402-2'-O)-methyltransferase